MVDETFGAVVEMMRTEVEEINLIVEVEEVTWIVDETFGAVVEVMRAKVDEVNWAVDVCGAV